MAKKKATKSNLLSTIKTRFNNSRARLTQFVAKHPARAFYILLALVVGLIVIGHFLRQPKTETAKEKPIAKTVAVFSIGEAPKIKVQAKVEKSGVIKIVAISGGIVNAIYKTEGQTVYQGETLAFLASNYNGASAPGVQRSLAAANYKFVSETYDTQKELIGKNREIIQKGNDQADAMREISSKSIEETKTLLSYNEGLLADMESALSTLPATSEAYTSARSGKASLLAGINQARSALRTLEYQTNDENEPAEIANLQEEVALKQLDIQEKSLELNKEVSRLNLALAQIQESLSYPSAPCAGIVERVYVQNGQFVAPGTPLFSIKSDKTALKLVALVSANIADKLSMVEPSLLELANETVEITPTYIATEPTDGGLLAVVYYPEAALALKNAEHVTLRIPMGQSDALSSVPFIPIDAVYQTNEDNYIYLARSFSGHYQVVSRQIELGAVYGGYVEVTKGLNKADKVIMDRNVIEGDRVKMAF